ncbi:flagellar biosynthetic protein FliR [Aureimonas glaciei]|jgi:flagellar biosynthetic protein FliR|uniref:Flagellar biosynthesis protein FliR n=1 Tax=Aureimonas glaciei TaxID=1776957 RepID=A0A916Y392_9HYPH|nr:flagellar biosynthetic protein FliR [Aureimonas glaciei]GGD27629.1 flagellar biosynthesis protein FliR [Aureimonas glaciei]
MTEEMTATILSLFLIFCRIGSCLMLLPGYSSVRIPTQIRLFVAFSISLAVSPGILPDMLPLMREAGDDVRLQMIVTEILNGMLIGLLGRVFMIALQFSANFLANAIGMGQAIGSPIDESEPAPAVVSLITMTATVLVFSLNLHVEILRALVASYSAMPVALGFAPRTGLVALTDNLDQTFHLGLRIASPFVIYGVIVNFAIGLANKMTPQIPIYFISMPFVIAGGLVLLAYSIGDYLTIFLAGFQQWVING